MLVFRYSFSAEVLTADPNIPNPATKLRDSLKMVYDPLYKIRSALVSCQV